MTVAHYVLLGRTAHLGPLGRESASDFDVVERALTQFDLLDLADRSLDTLSGGERQRAVLARGLAQEAPLLFLDEPTTSLDIGHQQDILDLVDDAPARARPHRRVDDARPHAHRPVRRPPRVMDDGKVAISGPPVQVLTSAQLRQHYGARVDVIRHNGNLVVVPWRPIQEGDPP